MSQTDHGKIAFERGDFEQARALFEEAAAAGDALGAHHLGTMCSQGQGGPADAARAVSLYRRAAEAGVEARRWWEIAAAQGDCGALLRIGSMVALGEGTKADLARAAGYWERAAKLGEVSAMLLLARYYQVSHPARSMRWFLEAIAAGDASSRGAAQALIPSLTAAAQAGDVEAEYNLGEALMTLGLDRAEAARWFAAAAEAEHPGAQRSLGILYEAGQIVPKDLVRAMVLYRAAAESGDAVAQYSVGICTLLGKGTTVDVESGISWLEKAAAQGLSRAFLPLANRLAELEREDEARPWFARAAEAGSPATMLHVGRWYRDGVGGPVDRAEAARWFMTAFVKHKSAEGIQEMHELVGAMSEDELWAAARLSGGESVAAAFLALRGEESE